MYLERNKSVPTEENITNFNLIFRACLMKNKLSDLLYNNFKQSTCYRMFSSIWKILREEEKDKWAKRGEKSVKISVYPLDKLARCRKLVSVEPIAEGDENPSRASLGEAAILLVRNSMGLFTCPPWCVMQALLANAWICKCVIFSLKQVRNSKKIYGSLWCRSIADNYYAYYIYK